MHSHSHTKTCIECGNTFSKRNQRQTTLWGATMCRDCYLKPHHATAHVVTPPEKKTCIICNDEFAPDNRLRSFSHDSDEKCCKCHGKQKITCIICNKVFADYGSAWNRLCASCEAVRTRLLDRTIDQSLVHENFVVRVTFDVHREDHDGYCSDPCDPTEEDVEEVKVYPLLKSIKNADLDDGYLHGKKLSFYCPRRCGHGNGYCGMETIYTIKTAKVIKKKRKIDLGD